MRALGEESDTFGRNAVSGQDAVRCHPPTLSEQAQNVKR